MVIAKNHANVLKAKRKAYKPLSNKKHGMKLYINESFTAVIHQEDEMYVAECPEVGTISQGKTSEDAVSNLKEATQLYLEGFPLTVKKKTPMTTFEVAMSAKA